MSLFKYYKTAKDNLGGFGGVPSFDLNCDYQSAEKSMDNLKIIKKHLPSVGIESLVTMPWETSHSYITEKERIEIGITPSLLRPSIGIENLEDIKNDINNAINKYKN